MHKKIIPECESKLTRRERFWNELQWLWIVAAVLAVAGVYLELSHRGFFRCCTH